jgi:hypothetical protein
MQPERKTRRGPKISLAPSPVPGGFESPVTLSTEEQQEFNRLVGIINSRGLLSKVDPQAVADLARMTCALTRAYQAVPIDAKTLTTFQNCCRGLRRELGLSLQSSRVVVRTTPGESDLRTIWRDKINGGGS